MLTNSEATEELGLASVLVRISRECDEPVERLRAEHLVRDAKAAWPGTDGQQWPQWLRETAECLSLRSRVEELTLDDALHLSQDGAVIVGGQGGDAGLTVLIGYDGKHAHVAKGEIDEVRKVSRSELASRISGGNGQATAPWVVVEHPELTNSDETRRLHGKPVKRLYRIVKPEWPDIWLILVFAFFAGVLNLATPVAVEALVNTVAFGRLLQPVLVLATLLFGFLAFASVMQAMQTYVAEIIQRRLFARVSADLAYRLPRVTPSKVGAAYGPELVNRFLDVVTLQKVVAQLLLDGVNIVLATLVGMTVLAFYHPWLLGFDVLLLVSIVSGLFVLGLGGISSGIDESKMKYKITAWFEDLMRCQQGFKTEGGAEFAIDRANLLTSGYLTARRSHFSILFRQIVFILGLQAVAGTILLGGGGWLVIQGQLSLGQLVAAELIVTTILTSLAKLGKHLEGFYDVVAAVDKLGALFDLEVERHDGLLSMPEGDGAALRLSKVRRNGAGTVLAQGLTAEVESGERVAILGPRGSGKSALAAMLYGTETPDAGHLEIERIDPADLRPDILRLHVAMVGPIELFEGSIAENVHLQRTRISPTDVRWALDAVGLLDEILRLKDGVDTRINASGGSLSTTQQRLLTIARAIASRPRLLIIDSALDALPDEDVERVIGSLIDPEQAWTLLVTTGRQSIAERFERTIRLDHESPPSERPRKPGNGTP